MLLLQLLLLAVVQAKLYVQHPDELSRKFPNAEIHSTLANFGHIPYGQALVSIFFDYVRLLKVGRLYFNETDPEGCDQDQAFEIELGEEDEQRPWIYIVERSRHCSYVTQVRNIEKAGGAVAIVVDSEDLPPRGGSIMSDDGSGAGI